MIIPVTVVDTKGKTVEAIAKYNCEQLELTGVDWCVKEILVDKYHIDIGWPRIVTPTDTLKLDLRSSYYDKVKKAIAMSDNIPKVLPLNSEFWECLQDGEVGEEFRIDGRAYSITEKGEWIDDGKNDYRQYVFYDAQMDVYYSAYANRSGSYHTDYFYDNGEEAYRVERKEVVKYEWKSV